MEAERIQDLRSRLDELEYQAKLMSNDLSITEENIREFEKAGLLKKIKLGLAMLKEINKRRPQLDLLLHQVTELNEDFSDLEDEDELKKKLDNFNTAAVNLRKALKAVDSEKESIEKL